MKTWIQTFTGRQFDVFAPDPAAIDVVDVAWHLSMKCRYNGATTRFYSVAEHSVVLSDHFMATTGDRLLGAVALLHDGNEAYLPDVPRPIKNGLTGWRELEAKVDRVIFDRFRLPWPMHEAVVQADGQIIRDEREQACSRTALDWAGTGQSDLPGLGITLPCWGQKEAFEAFLLRFWDLMPQGHYE